MAKNIKLCRVCGKPFEACRSAKNGDGVFRWKEVACSPEHGAEYLRRINMSRGVKPEVESVPVSVEPVTAAPGAEPVHFLSKKERRELEQRRREETAEEAFAESETEE